MKKFLLKGKQFFTKKLQDLDIETESINYVSEQIPTRLKEPLQILMNLDIDLEETTLYQTYFKNYPTHHLSQYLLEKYQNKFNSNVQPLEYTLPTKDVFIPQYDKKLQQKALLFREVIQDYDEGFTQVQQPIICMSVVHFHHKRGAEVQFSYPKTTNTKIIEENIVHHAMPDSSHNKQEDYNFFNFEMQLDGKKRMLFGVAFFKQIKVTAQMRQKNAELTRSSLQKAVCIISQLPLFGFLKIKLTITTKLFFENFTQFQIIQKAYQDITAHVKNNWQNMSIQQLYFGSNLSSIIEKFGAQQLYEIWKAILYQRRIVVYAHLSSLASSFVLSLLTLFPGLCTFGVYSKPISRYMQALRQYALPLRLFSSENFMAMSFHIQDFHLLQKFQKTKEGHFLIGTTNRLLKQQNDYGVQLLINLDEFTIQKGKHRIVPWESLSKKQKYFISQLQTLVKKENIIAIIDDQELIREAFYKHLKKSLVEIILANNFLHKFIKQCKQYQKKSNKETSKNKRKRRKSEKQQYLVMEEQQADQEQNIEKKFNKSSDQFPPQIPKQVLNIPFPGLIMQRSFTYFLQFHNKNLPELLSSQNKTKLTLKIQDDEYILEDPANGQFIGYCIFSNKLYFGKGQHNQDHTFQGKQLRFDNNINNSSQNKNKVISVFIGAVKQGRYTKSCFNLDENQVYEGDYINGAKNGYGRLSNKLHKYIGFFQNNLYSGDGQLVIGQDLYVGQFKEGMKHGCGKTQGPHLIYDGQWKNDHPHGNGVLTEKSSQGVIQYIGKFQKGFLNEQKEVTIRYPNGSMYKGKIKDKKPHGQGLKSDQNGDIIMGIFSEGQLVRQINQLKQQQANIQEAVLQRRQQ